MAEFSYEAENMIPAPAGSATPRTIYASEDGIMLCYGTTAPIDASVGYAPGCKFFDIDSGTEYINEGSATSCDFNVKPAVVAQSTVSDPASAAALTQNTLTDSGGGTADQTVEDVTDIALSTSDTYTDAAVNAAVNTAIASISNNFKEMTTELALIKTDVAAVRTGSEANNTAIDSIIDGLESAGVFTA